MCKDWELSKEEYIKRYFADKPEMWEIAERAFNGNCCAQDALADYFDRTGELVEAERWRQKAREVCRSYGDEY